MAKQVALHLRAAQHAEQFPLLFSLDTLRNGDDIARFGNQSDCLHDGERIVVVSDILNKGLIDLDLWSSP
jgi:hypothetical protein